MKRVDVLRPLDLGQCCLGPGELEVDLGVHRVLRPPRHSDQPTSGCGRSGLGGAAPVLADERLDQWNLVDDHVLRRPVHGPLDLRRLVPRPKKEAVVL